MYRSRLLFLSSVLSSISRKGWIHFYGKIAWRTYLYSLISYAKFIICILLYLIIAKWFIQTNLFAAFAKDDKDNIIQNSKFIFERIVIALFFILRYSESFNLQNLIMSVWQFERLHNTLTIGYQLEEKYYCIVMHFRKMYMDNVYGLYITHKCELVLILVVIWIGFFNLQIWILPTYQLHMRLHTIVMIRFWKYDWMSGSCSGRQGTDFLGGSGM